MIFLDKDSVSRSVLEYTHINQIISVHQSIYKRNFQRNLYVHFTFVSWGGDYRSHWGTLHMKYFSIMYHGLKMLKACYKHDFLKTFSNLIFIKIGVINNKDFCASNWVWKDTTIERINSISYNRFLKDIFSTYNNYNVSAVYDSLLKIFRTPERSYKYVCILYESISVLPILKTISAVAFNRLLSYIMSAISPISHPNPFLKEMQNKVSVNPFLRDATKLT